MCHSSLFFFLSFSRPGPSNQGLRGRGPPNQHCLTAGRQRYRRTGPVFCVMKCQNSELDRTVEVFSAPLTRPRQHRCRAGRCSRFACESGPRPGLCNPAKLPALGAVEEGSICIMDDQQPRYRSFVAPSMVPSRIVALCVRCVLSSGRYNIGRHRAGTDISSRRCESRRVRL